MALQTALVSVNYVGNGTDNVFDVDFSQKLLQQGILETPVSVDSRSPGISASIIRKSTVRLTFAVTPPAGDLGSPATAVIAFRLE